MLLLFEVRSQCGYGFSFDQLEVSWQFYPFFDRSPCEMTKKKPKFGALPKLNMPTKSKEASLTPRPERSVVKCNEGPLPQLLQWIFRALPAS